MRVRVRMLLCAFRVRARERGNWSPVGGCAQEKVVSQGRDLYVPPNNSEKNVFVP